MSGALFILLVCSSDSEWSSLKAKPWCLGFTLLRPFWGPPFARRASSVFALSVLFLISSLITLRSKYCLNSNLMSRLLSPMKSYSGESSSIL